MKVKAFTANNSYELETEINKFLETDLIYVRDIKYCFNDSGGHAAIIIYSMGD